MGSGWMDWRGWSSKSKFKKILSSNLYFKKSAPNKINFSLNVNFTLNSDVDREYLVAWMSLLDLLPEKRRKMSKLFLLIFVQLDKN